jgi:cytochrome c oxidase subunit IV
VAQHQHEHHQHVTPQRTYLLAGLALAILTLVTVGVAYLDLGPLNDVVAVGVASLKAFIIVTIFMHGRQTSGVTRLVMVAGLLWFAILVVGTLDDYLTRDWLGIPSK